ncbi:class A beta-lactamase-related serine hydrolase [Larkinella knui]|uniref:Class A beta-lactamase-related serine hydrolase n=2 Tax=Larkinella knui TaxID=2025310 RepID=A0A3P1CI70_9BACT|nr:class A beta-lactamase-related serine hydrolase [Larkinella knui]
MAFVTLFSLLAAFGQAQNKPATTTFAQLDRAVKQLMDSARVPGLSLVWIQKGQVSYRKAYGFTKADSTQQVDSNTVFEAASLTKPLFAYAVLQLVDEGRLDLDKPLFEYLPYPDVADDERYTKITARLVLSHRTGFPNWRKNRRSSELTLLRSPGERFGYSGEGFVYLQKVVEKITGEPIQAFMENRVLKPLGMTHSSFIWQPAFTANYAQPHNESGEVGQKYQPAQANMAYSLHTTAPDYARFFLAIFNATGLKPATVDQMLSPQSQLPTRFSGSDTLAAGSYWGLGIGLEQTPGETYFWHWGDNGAFKCFIMANRTRKDAVVYFANGSNGLDFADEIVRLTVGGQHPAFPFLGINWRAQAGKSAKK